jgi:hypothetical protein
MLEEKFILPHARTFGTWVPLSQTVAALYLNINLGHWGGAFGYSILCYLLEEA